MESAASVSLPRDDAFGQVEDPCEESIPEEIGDGPTIVERMAEIDDLRGASTTPVDSFPRVSPELYISFAAPGPEDMRAKSSPPLRQLPSQVPVAGRLRRRIRPSSGNSCMVSIVQEGL